MTSAAPAPLAALPADVFARTFSFVDGRGLGGAILTCRRWRDIMQHIMQHEGFWRSILAYKYPRVEAAAWRVSTSSPLAALSDEVLARIVSFFDADDAAAFANACRGDGSVTIWRALLASKSEAAARGTEGGWRGLFIYTESLVALAEADDQLNDGLAQFVEGIRGRTELYGLSNCWQCDEREYQAQTGNPGNSRPHPSPTEGTTATVTPDATGAYSSPVYFDWGAKWERVKDLVPTPAVQTVLETCVNRVSDGYNFDPWNAEKVWPFYFMGKSRFGDGVQDELMRQFLPTEHVAEMNGRYADWYRSEGEALLAEEYNPVGHAEGWIGGGLESGEDISEEGFAANIRGVANEINRGEYANVFEATTSRRAMIGSELAAEISEISERVLYHKDSSLRETLLCTPSNSQAFLPLNYILARLLSPEDAQLRVYVSSHYGVVIDERRNILFDNCAYFDEMPASDILERSMGPQLPPTDFDYSLGGLVTP